MRVRTWLHRLAPFAVAATLVAVIVGVATGAGTTATDRNDTKGSLDIREIRYGWVPDSPPWWRVRTFDAWTARFLWDKGYLFVEFDTRGDDRPDFYALAYSNGRRVRGELFEIGPVRDRRVRAVAVGRPNRTNVTLRFPWSALEFGVHRDTFRWWVTTSYSNDGCPRSCIDRAPDEGGIEEWRPGLSPTPSPTTTTTTTTATPT